MRKYYTAVCIVAFIYLLGIVFFCVFTANGSGVSDGAQSVVILNEITQDARQNWDDPDAITGKQYGVDYVIINTVNDVIAASDEKFSNLTVEAAIKNHYSYSYIVKDGQVVGSVILPDKEYGGYSRIRTGLIVGLVLFGALMTACACVYGTYINKSIIIPFRELKDFAGSIAEGNLDEPLKMDKDNIFGAFTESFDIMREELADSKAREIALQKKERELVASLSHDLKTPITGIKLTTELLKTKISMQDETDSNKDMIGKLDNIYKKADQIDALVSDLFASALDDLGEFKVNCIDERSAVLADILARYDDRGRVKATELPEVLIHIDIKRMSQVIGNIIANSYKYADTEIDVAYKTVEGSLQMKIADHGPGVPAEELDLITNKFYRGKQWEKGEKDGSGLGLYISKTLMEKMDGELIAESDGKGLCITLMIPLS